MNSLSRRISCAILLILILAVWGTGAALAGTLALGYDGGGIYPPVASANSERYFRVQVTWNPTSEHFDSLVLSCSAGTYDLRQNRTNLDVQSGVTTYTVSSSSSSQVVVYTIGPFAGYEYSSNPLSQYTGPPHGGTINAKLNPGEALATPQLPTQGMSTNQARFTARFTTTATTPVTSTVTTAYIPERVVNDNQDYLQWYNGQVTGIDPLSVDPATITPDDGTGSSRYRFRVRYAKWSNSQNIPPRTRTATAPPGGTYNFARHTGGGNFAVTTDRSSHVWFYDTHDDWHSLDMVGDSMNIGSIEPQVMLIIDGDLKRPRFMHKEDPNNESYDAGVIYYYDLMPTDYKRYLENVFLFPYDPVGHDPLDQAFLTLKGRPMSNNYVALSAGGHTYEFIASDDFSPCLDDTWCQVGRPGDGMHNDYIRLERDMRQQTDRFYVNGTQRTRHDRISSPPRNTIFEDGPGKGYGYPYDSQDRTQYPKVNPVLSAHPYFPSGTIRPSIPYVSLLDPSYYLQHLDPDPLDAGGQLVHSPFPAETGFGPNPPQRYTNDDTILPNYVNIHHGTALTPFRGGKWTDQSLYTFRINYWQSDNIAPSDIRVWIRKVAVSGSSWSGLSDWKSFTMEQRDPSDRDYTNGCVFQFQATPDQLPGGGGSGDYNYYFTASDGTRTTLFPNRPGVSDMPGASSIRDPGHYSTSNMLGQYGVPTSAAGEKYYWFRANTAPQLSAQAVSPAAGGAGQNYKFEVTYRDTDGAVLSASPKGDRPFLSKIYLDLFGQALGATEVATVASATSLTYSTSSTQLYPNGSLTDSSVPYTLTMLTGTAAGMTYTITGNSGDAITLAAGTNLSADGVASGDKFRIAQWFTGTMQQADPSAIDYAAGVVYQFDTATNVELGAGVHRYYFEFTDNWGDWLFPGDANVSVEGETVRYPASNNSYFTGPEVRDNTPPILRDFRFSPRNKEAGEPDGTTATEFVFYVTYEDYDNDPPSFIRVGIDGTPTAPNIVLNMVPDTPEGGTEDKIYTDGAIYRSQPIQLDEGTHVFYAQASDGKARFPATAPGDPPYYSGPEDPDNPGTLLVSVDGPYVAANIAPTLTFPADDDGTTHLDPGDPLSPIDPPGLEPNVGLSTTDFTYRVIYTSAVAFGGLLGNPPEFVRVFIDGVPHDMEPADPDDHDYTAGVLFEYTLDGLQAATPHTYFFLASDGLDHGRLPVTGVEPYRYDGPLVLAAPRPANTLRAWDTPNDHGHSVNLEFYASLDDEGGEYDVKGYNIYRSETPGEYPETPVLTIPASTASAYAAKDCAPDSANPPRNEVPYYYVVRAFVNAWGISLESEPTDEAGPVRARDNIAPLPPTGVSVSNPGTGSVLDINWTISVDDPDDGSGADDVTEYRIYRRLNADPVFAPPAVGNVPAGTTEFHDATVEDGQAYVYMVRAFDGTQESANSNVVGPEIPSDLTPPAFSDETPAPGATEVELDTVISFTVEDTGIGVDENTIEVEVTVGGSAVAGSVAVTGTAASYAVEFTPDEPFAWNAQVHVAAKASDLNSNAATTEWVFKVRADIGVPQITPVTPVADATEIPLDTTVIFTVQDTVSGIDLSTLEGKVMIGGVEVSGTPNITATATGYEVEFTPDEPFAWNAMVQVQVKVSDFAGNEANANWEFAVRKDAGAPVITPVEPTDGAVVGDPNTSIKYTVEDAISGVDAETIQTVVTDGGVPVPGTQTITGTPAQYQVVFTPTDPIEWDAQIHVVAQAADMAGNATTEAWDFAIHDTTGPVVARQRPADGATGVSHDATVRFTVEDPGIGVDQSTIVTEITIGGTPVPAVVTITGDNARYNLECTPEEPFPWNVTVDVEVRAQDLSGNGVVATWSFLVSDDSTAPEVTRLFPADGAVSVSTGASITFHLTDDKSGVDVNIVDGKIDAATSRVAVIFDGQDVTGSVEASEVNGALDVACTFTPSDGMEYNRTYLVRVSVRDVAGNTSGPVEWSFDTRQDTTAPTIDQRSPAGDETDVPVDSALSVRITDTESGVFADRIRMWVDGTEVSSALVKTRDGASVQVDYTPSQPFARDKRVGVRIYAEDRVGNSTEQTHSFTTAPPVTYVIAGRTLTTDGEPIVGVHITVDGQTVVTDGNGAYQVSDLPSGTFTVSASRDLWNFEPPARQVTLDPADATGVDFIGSPVTFQVSGRVVDRSGVGVAGVAISWDQGSVLTDAEGLYTITNLPPGHYTFTPALQYQHFDPVNRLVEVTDADVPGVSFTVIPDTFSISGAILDAQGNPLQGAEVRYSGGVAVSDATGRYVLSSVPMGTHTLTASLSGHKLLPDSLDVQVPPDHVGADFTGYQTMSTTFPAGVSMVAVPGTPTTITGTGINDNPVNVFGTERVARWDPWATPATYRRGPEWGTTDLMRVRSGSGFFVRYAAATSIAIAGPLADAGRTVSIPLAVGWNMIGNPFANPTQLGDFRPSIADGVRPYAFVYNNATGSYELVSSKPAVHAVRNNLQPWEGAWILCLTAGSSLNVSASADSAAIGKAEAIQAGAGYLVPIVATAAGRSDTCSVAGVIPGGSAEHSLPNPPTAPATVDVYFIASNGEALARDIRDDANCAQSYEFVVSCSVGPADVSVALPDLSSVPHQYDVVLTDVEANRSVYARTSPSYSYRATETDSLRHFRLEVRPRTAASLAVSTATAVQQGDNSVLSYSVSQSCKVDISVRNIAGVPIRTLAADQPVGPGLQTQSWNLRNDAGARVPTGSYLVEIRAKGEDGQQARAIARVQLAR